MGYFVQIQKPKEFRRDVLESSVKTIGCLQTIRNVLFIREKKRKLLEQLRDEVKELSMLVANLDKVLPDKHLREEALAEKKNPKKKTQKTAKKKAAKKEPLPEPKSANEEERLNKLLSSIESRLSTLK